MYIPFDKLPPNARIWIYQSDKIFSEKDKNIISAALRSFTEQWNVHGTPMDASFDIRFDRFIILGANDQASGCSIDSSVRTVKEIGEMLGCDLFNRNLVALSKVEGIILIPLNELKTKLAEGVWNNDTPVFNNHILTRAELETTWLVPAGSSWLKRYLPRETISQ